MLQVLFFNSEVNENLNLSFKADGQCFYFIDTKVVKKFNKVKGTLEPTLDYKIYPGSIYPGSVYPGKQKKLDFDFINLYLNFISQSFL